MFLFITEINVKRTLSYIPLVTNVLACFLKLILHTLFFPLILSYICPDSHVPEGLITHSAVTLKSNCNSWQNSILPCKLSK